MDLVKLINDKVEEFDSNGKIEKLVAEKTEAMINNILTDIFRPYSKLTESLQKEIEGKLKIDISNIDFPTYNEQMLAGVKGAMSKAFSDNASDRLMKELDELFGPAPKEISITDLVEKVFGFWRDDNHDEENECMSIKFEEDSVLKGYYGLDLGKSECRYNSSVEVRLWISKDGDIRLNHKHKYNPTCLHSEDGFIYKLYAANTKITGLEEFDPDDIDTSYPNNEDY